VTAVYDRTVVSSLRDVDNVEARGFEGDRGWTVAIHDLDSRETLQMFRLFPRDRRDEAIAFARTCVGVVVTTSAGRA
jgi:hypothetical protein